MKEDSERKKNNRNPSEGEFIPGSDAPGNHKGSDYVHNRETEKSRSMYTLTRDTERFMIGTPIHILMVRYKLSQTNHCSAPPHPTPIYTHMSRYGRQGRPRRGRPWSPVRGDIPLQSNSAIQAGSDRTNVTGFIEYNDLRRNEASKQSRIGCSIILFSYY
jgi:hypothetical protein